jgi:hypothetical protein
MIADYKEEVDNLINKKTPTETSMKTIEERKIYKVKR